jgi:hypothetical protein
MQRELPWRSHLLPDEVDHPQDGHSGSPSGYLRDLKLRGSRQRPSSCPHIVEIRGALRCMGKFLLPSNPSLAATTARLRGWHVTSGRILNGRLEIP